MDQHRSDGGDEASRSRFDGGEASIARTSSPASMSSTQTPAISRTRPEDVEGSDALGHEGGESNASDDGIADEEEEEDPQTFLMDDADAAQGQAPAQYSNEARVYHARYAELSQAHDEGRYEYCREGSLSMLTEPRVPLLTRVQVLQMVSTLLTPAGAKSCLQEANSILMDCDPESRATQLLLEDNGKMWRDLYERFGDALESDGDDDDGEDEDEVASDGETQKEIEEADQ